MDSKMVKHGRKLLAAATPGPWGIRRLNGAVSSEGFVQAPRVDPAHPYDIEVLGEDDTLYPTRRGDMEFIVWVRNNAEALFDLIEASSPTDEDKTR
jgi:hypothetical protein